MANRTEAYDLSLFEPQVVRQPPVLDGKDSFAAKRAADREQERREEQKRLNAAHRARVQGQQRILKAAAFSAFSLFCIAMMIFSRAQSDDLSRQIDSVKRQLDISQSENVRLTAQMNAAVSIDRVEKYAEEELGMVKMQRSQVTYIDRSNGDEVVVSGGEVKDGDGPLARINELFAYLP